jgi:parallel beta-helix repeat protein
MVIFLFLATIPNNPTSISSKLPNESKAVIIGDYTEHGPIVIDDDSDFVTYGFSGSGNPGDPYMIEGLRIVSDTGKPAIAITGTITKYFRISNCTIEATNGLSAHGIEINATCTYDPLIEKSFITAEGTGIVCQTTNTYINNNTIYDSNFGIDISSITDYSCSFVDIKRNKITNCNGKAITITDSTNNTLYSNRIYNCSWGIFLSNVQNATIEYNKYFEKLFR